MPRRASRRASRALNRMAASRAEATAALKVHKVVVVQSHRLRKRLGGKRPKPRMKWARTKNLAPTGRQVRRLRRLGRILFRRRSCKIPRAVEELGAARARRYGREPPSRRQFRASNRGPSRGQALASLHHSGSGCPCGPSSSAASSCAPVRPMRPASNLAHRPPQRLRPRRPSSRSRPIRNPNLAFLMYRALALRP